MPVTGPDGNVVAVANGGLGYYEEQRNGLKIWKDTELVWAIPVKNVLWADAKDPKVRREIDRVAALDLLAGFAIGDPKQMRLVLAEYAVLEATGDMLVTVMKQEPGAILPKLAGDFFKEIGNIIPKNDGKVDASPSNAKKVIDDGKKKLDELFFIVPSGTQVQILKDQATKSDSAPKDGIFPMGIPQILPDGGGYFKVRILTSEHEGEEGWVAAPLVKKKQLFGKG